MMAYIIAHVGFFGHFHYNWTGENQPNKGKFICLQLYELTVNNLYNMMISFKKLRNNKWCCEIRI